MIIGTGIDIVDLKRIEDVIKRQPRFVDRILTESEKRAYLLLTSKRKIEFLAGRFAAKEAFVKAAGTGISSTYSWHDIEVKKKPSGQPYLAVARYDERIHLSISHSKMYAVANVIIESSPS